MDAYKNIGLLFNKHYFREIDFAGDIDTEDNQKALKNVNSALYVSQLGKNMIDLPENLQNITLHTIYPGLLLGSGSAHESSIVGELKLGFHFDYTTGLPLIPGSSVKGVLRSAFEKAGGEYVKDILKGLKEDLKLTEEQANDLIDNKVKVENVKDEIPLLEAHIFHGIHKVKEIYTDKDGNKQERVVIKNLSVYQRDTFFDAFPIATANKDKKFLANDYITPHKDPLKNPIPLQFLKVLPQVTFQFSFRLHNFKDEDEEVLLTAEQKMQLFKHILLDLGVGAKTNVGYGQFVEVHDIEEYIIELVDLENVRVDDFLECKIKEIIYRENDSKYQVYLMPPIKYYEKYLKNLNKPFPSIRVENYIYRQIKNLDSIKCKVKKVTDHGRVLFSDDLIIN